MSAPTEDGIQFHLPDNSATWVGSDGVAATCNAVGTRGFGCQITYRGTILAFTDGTLPPGSTLATIAEAAGLAERERLQEGPQPASIPARQLQQARLDARVTLRDAAFAIAARTGEDITSATVSEWERGRRQPSLSAALAWIDTFDMRDTVSAYDLARVPAPAPTRRRRP